MLKDLEKRLKSNVAPMYLLVGTEEYLLEKAEDLIVNEVLKGEVDDFNFQSYDMKETQVSVALEDAQTPSFFGNNKVIIVKPCIFLTAQKEKLIQNIDSLTEYIEDPSPFTTLIFVAPFEKLDERKKITKLLKKHTELVECKPIEIDNLTDWIKQHFPPTITITEDAIQKIKDLVGSNLSILNSECEKLALYIGDSGEITAELVEKMVAKTIEQNVFSLVEKIAARNTTEALTIFRELLAVGEEPIKILALLASQFRLIYGIKNLSSNGYSNNQIASSLSVSPGRVFYGQKQANLFEDKELKHIIQLIAETDYAMKTGQADKILLTELLMLKMNSIG